MKSIVDVSFFEANKMQAEEATLYYDKVSDLTHICVGQDQYRVDIMTLTRLGEFETLEQKLQRFTFTDNYKVNGVISLLQDDNYYMVTLIVPYFSGINGPSVPHDVIVLKIGNAFEE